MKLLNQAINCVNQSAELKSIGLIDVLLVAVVVCVDVLLDDETVGDVTGAVTVGVSDTVGTYGIVTLGITTVIGLHSTK